LCALTTTVRKDFPETWIWSNTSVRYGWLTGTD
jgi:hypothetical protein